MTSALLYGIEPTLAKELTGALALLDVRCRVATERERAGVQAVKADIAFASSDPTHIRSLISELRLGKPELPVVVVSRNPEVSQWIDSLEEGADDYCCAPFEPKALRWILEANLNRSRQAA